MTPSHPLPSEPDLAALREAAQAYIDWRDKRIAQWNAVARHDHEHGMTPCPEWDELTSEPFDIDQQLDDAIRAALAANPEPARDHQYSVDRPCPYERRFEEHMRVVHNAGIPTAPALDVDPDRRDRDRMIQEWGRIAAETNSATLKHMVRTWIAEEDAKDATLSPAPTTEDEPR